LKYRARPAGSARRAERSGGAGGGRGPAWYAHPAFVSAAAALLLHLPALANGFVRDDHDLVAANPFLRRPGWLFQLLASDFWASSGGDSGLWRPVVLLSYWIDGRLGGWQPGLFHLTNVVLHAATTALVALLAAQGGAPRVAALVAGLWFAAMPAHVESVAWISGRTDVLCAVFFAAALVLDRRARAAGAALPGAWAVAAFALSLLSKEAAAPLPLVFAIACRVEPGPIPATPRRVAAWCAPYLAVLAAYLVAHGAVTSAASAPAWVDAAERAARHRAGWTMLPGFVAFLWPWYPHSPERWLPRPSSATSPEVLAGAAAVALALALLGLAVARRSRTALPLAVFLVATGVPVALAVSRGYVTFAERLLYLPSIGAAWLGGLAIATWGARGGAHRALAGATAAVLVAASSWRTATLLPTWRDDATMFETMVRVQPRHPEARVGWAGVLIERGRETEAEAQLSEAERLDPRQPALHAARSLLALRRGDWARALADARRALELEPNRHEARLVEATALMRLERLDEAEGRVADLRRRVPGEPGVETLWGQLQLLRGRPGEAFAALSVAARWAPDDPAVAYALGVAGLGSGRTGEARAALKQAVRLAPAHYDAWLRLAWAEHLLRDDGAAEVALSAAERLPQAADGRVVAVRARIRAGEGRDPAR
jgi:Flp pilus assembly protein TadD